MSKKKMTVGLIVGNRGFFPDRLANSGREEMIAVLQNTGMDVVALSAQESKCGAVTTRQDVHRCVELFKMLVPSKSVVSLGAAIFAFLAAGTFNTVEEAQEHMCPPHMEYLPDPAEQSVYEVLYSLYSKLYFAFGTPGSGPMSDVLPRLIQTAQSVMQRSAL